MAGVWLTTFQICLPLEGPGPSHRRKLEQVVFVVAEKPEEVGKVIAENVALEPNEIVEITQLRQLEAGRKVFTARPPKKKSA